MQLGIGYPAYHYQKGNTTLCTTEAKRDLEVCYQTTNEGQIQAYYSKQVT